MVEICKTADFLRNALERSRITVGEIKMFGSYLDPESFDDQSDLDFVAVGDGFMFVDELHVLGFSRLKGCGANGHFRHEPDPASFEWDGGRKIDLLIVRSDLAESLMLNPVNEKDVFSVAIHSGQNIK